MFTEAKLFMTSSQTYEYWVYFQDEESAGAKAFLEAAATTDDIPFAMTSNDAVFSEYKVTQDTVVLFKKVSCRLNMLQVVQVEGIEFNYFS